jgi:hypothetical protein
VFPVVENYVERQLEVDRALFDDLEPQALVQCLRTARAAEAMRDQPGRRVVVRCLAASQAILDIEALRKT